MKILNQDPDPKFNAPAEAHKKELQTLAAEIEKIVNAPPLIVCIGNKAYFNAK